VDDVDQWLSSPKREELFGPLGVTARPLRDVNGSGRVGLIVETPGISTWEQALQTEEAAEATKHDDIRPSTLVSMVEDS
jgi:hypothetical protein